MDEFMAYGNTFQESLENLEKVLIRCQEMNLSLSHEKIQMLLTEGIVLGHHVSTRIINPPFSNLVICLNQESCLNRESIQSIFSHQHLLSTYLYHSWISCGAAG